MPQEVFCILVPIITKAKTNLLGQDAWRVGGLMCTMDSIVHQYMHRCYAFVCTVLVVSMTQHRYHFVLARLYNVSVVCVFNSVVFESDWQ